MSMPKQQSGVSFGGFIILAFVLIVVVLFGFKLIPAYIENAKIQSVFEQVAHDPALQGAGAREAWASFDRRASVEGITALKSSDIEVDKGADGRPVLSADYSVKVKVGGNVSLIIEFNPSSAGK
ncbi:MAG: DUF4845 domain-containing protein [Gallionella sp.]